MYDIITVPDPVLKQTASPIERVDDSVRAQMDKMLDTMYDAPGIGLAANQVNLLNRVVVMDLSYRDDGEDAAPICMANPEILWISEDTSTMDEGCLSIPEQLVTIERPSSVRVRFLNYDGERTELEASGLLSHCIQHEIDHLNGRLIIDDLSSLRRNLMIKKVQKIVKQRQL